MNVWTDGACANNGRSDARAAIGVFFWYNHPSNVSRRVPNWHRQTNNIAEILAATEGAQQALDGGVRRLRINTDSKYLMFSIKDWLSKWRNNGWKNSKGFDVANQEEIVQLDDTLQCFDAVEWRHVEAHSGIPQNEMADKFAREATSDPDICASDSDSDSDSDY